ncbi:hypothetical protein C0J52_17815 [Blattella germanica]|nr:hypothetical protein C0J52_17815 [Blattella germanica]
MEENSLTCPLCRKRIGGWLRTATKEHNLVNNELWASIQKFFPEQVQAKLNGQDDGVEEQAIGRVSTHISSTGEIRKEYELHVKKLEEENRKKFESERTASETLIRKIQSTSGLVNKKDPGSSRAGMDNKENKNRSHGSASTQIRDLERVRSASNLSSCSHDSINEEMHHFKPIKSVPRTPPKKLSGKAYWQKPDSYTLKCDVEQSTEDMESPRKKPRQDTSEEQRTNFALSELSSYSNEDCEGKKVIAIVHNQVDALAEGEGKIGGHDRRFGGSEKEDSCSYNLSNKESIESDDESADIDYGNPNVTSIIGVDPEFFSQPTDVESCSKNKLSPVMCSSGMKLKMDKLSINPSARQPLNRFKSGYHNKKNNGKNHLNNNDISNIIPSNHSKNSQATERSSGKCKDNLDEILPFIDEDPATLSNEQTRIETMIRQEKEDFELAMRLSREWELADRIVDRRKGSLRAYELRNTCKSQAKKKKGVSKYSGNNRQSTLEESFSGAVRSRKR